MSKATRERVSVSRVEEERQTDRSRSGSAEGKGPNTPSATSGRDSLFNQEDNQNGRERARK